MRAQLGEFSGIFTVEPRRTFISAYVVLALMIAGLGHYTVRLLGLVLRVAPQPLVLTQCHDRIDSGRLPGRDIARGERQSCQEERSAHHQHRLRHT